MNEGLAELYGAMIGDGCLSESKSEGRTRRRAILTGNLKNDMVYYNEGIRSIISENFDVKGYLQKRSKRNCVYLVMSESIFDFFKLLNFPVGKKNKLEIPVSLMNDGTLSKACVRGIFDTDGSIYRRYSDKNYLVIQFKMKSRKVIEQIRIILLNSGFSPNKIIVDGSCSVLRLTKQKEIHRFFDEVKPSNKYHVERYLNKCKKVSVTGS
jgi:DNA-binding transcriptional regulator WhiA